MSARGSYDVVVVGGGHNGLTAAAYLARAGMSVLVLERLDHTGGAAISTEAFPGLPARLSRYSYLVSLLPESIAADLELDVELRSRSVASYSPTIRDGRSLGLLVEHEEGRATQESFRALTGSDDEYAAWQQFYGDVRGLAERVAPTLTQPLVTARAMAEGVDPEIWSALVERPIGEVIEKRFADDLVRGVVATDALIGTFADVHDTSLIQNRCFLYHLIGNGTGEWRVPVRGMGSVTDALARAAAKAGAEVLTNAGVSAIRADGDGAEVTWHDGDREHSVRARTVLSNVAPWVLRILLGEEPDAASKPVGSQLKINFLLSRLPRLKSGVDPRTAFAGTFHVGEEYDALGAAYRSAAAGDLPASPPGELYCHSLTDPSILGELASFGAHTLTYFGLHLPEPLFAVDSEERRLEAVRRAIAGIDEHLMEPLLGCVMTGPNGELCVEAKFPQDIEADLAMPGGHIFHGDLAWPWASNRESLATPAQQWGVATDLDSVLLCGSGARRGGAVSGLGGHNAAQAVLASR
ncbi:phytoene desaturase family protein [Nocardioides marmorisolisilvae]|uniref:Pyridine nucleotide-disulfide oxidoreductase domain-containing protein 2 n=1 Tax=Nocardioides marmorisolisilvae TaxID=1542737 RepID=A0A3N0DSY6_9ACTN|nr:NAD(P)/FAD-dependent oxidoreductase [Nocardioides marmorisolisilvae]RNL78739.1 NAD(P)/FAD-dependent oxidoreductase [Nocardioides marmorisolisilvae]